jgi:predicted phage terminase large subunit-like protein
LAVLLALDEALRGGAVMWVAPTFDKAMIGWRLFEELVLFMPGLVSMRRGERRITTASRGSISIHSADSEGGLRGEGLSLVVIDEAAHIKDLKMIWETELRPALTDRMGKAVFISTPAGFNYFYELFRMADNDPNWQSWQLPSSANPFLDKSELESARQHLPALVYRQEYEAEFVQLEGALFRREFFELVDNLPALVKVARYWDLAASTKTYSDYSAGVKVGVDKDGFVYVMDCVRGRWEWPVLIRIIGNTARAEKSHCTQYVEAVGAQRGMLDLLNAEPTLVGIAFRGVTLHKDKIARANAFLARAEQGKVRLVRGAWNNAWLDEICAFPAAGHDDQVDATVGAFNALQSNYAGLVDFYRRELEKRDGRN